MWNRKFRSEEFEDEALVYYCLKLLCEPYKQPTYKNLHQDRKDFFALLDYLTAEGYISGYKKSTLKSGDVPNFTSTRVLDPGKEYLDFHDDYKEQYKQLFF